MNEAQVAVTAKPTDTDDRDLDFPMVEFDNGISSIHLDINSERPKHLEDASTGCFGYFFLLGDCGGSDLDPFQGLLLFRINCMSETATVDHCAHLVRLQGDAPHDLLCHLGDAFPILWKCLDQVRGFVNIDVRLDQHTLELAQVLSAITSGFLGPLM